MRGVGAKLAMGAIPHIKHLNSFMVFEFRLMTNVETTCGFVINR